MTLIRLVLSPPSTVRCTQLNSTLFTNVKSPPMPTLGLRPELHAQRLWWNVLFNPPMVEPNAWAYVLRPSLKIEFWIVMLTVGSFSSLPPSGGWYMCRYIDMFSSRPQLAET